MDGCAVLEMLDGLRELKILWWLKLVNPSKMHWKAKCTDKEPRMLGQNAYHWIIESENKETTSKVRQEATFTTVSSCLRKEVYPLRNIWFTNASSFSHVLVRPYKPFYMYRLSMPVTLRRDHEVSRIGDILDLWLGLSGLLWRQAVGSAVCWAEVHCEGGGGSKLTKWAWKDHRTEHLQLLEFGNLFRSMVSCSRSFLSGCRVGRYTILNESE